MSKPASRQLSIYAFTQRHLAVTVRTKKLRKCPASTRRTRWSIYSCAVHIYT